MLCWHGPVVASGIIASEIVISEKVASDIIATDTRAIDWAANIKWVPIKHKQALICPIEQLSACLALMPSSIQQDPAFTHSAIKSAIGYKSAMVLAVSGVKDIAGMIVTQVPIETETQTGLIGRTTYQMTLTEQPMLTLWHEVGHLQNIELQGSVLPAKLTRYQHEWLADIYLVWWLSQTQTDFDLVWQQYHRRNLALINDSENMSHWSSPQLQIVLDKFSLQQINDFPDYASFLTAVYPHIPTWSTRDIQEFSSLIQRTFTSVHPLPSYMSWRQPALIQVLSPTLNKLMGKQPAQQWLQQQFSTVKKM